MQQRNQAAALLIALLVMALIAAVVAGLLARQMFYLRQTRAIFEDSSHYFLAQGELAWAKAQLLNRKQGLVLPLDHQRDLLAGLQIKTQLLDAQAYFNVNNLLDAKHAALFISLLRQIRYPKPKRLKHLIVNYLGFSDQEKIALRYRQHNLLYTPPHQKLFVLSQLRQVLTVTDKDYQQLKPYLIVLPAKVTKININTAIQPLLQAMLFNLSTAKIEQVLVMRQQHPFTDIKQLQQKFSTLNSDLITVSSHYFLLRTQVILNGEVVLHWQSLLHKRGLKNIDIVWQQRSE